MSTSLPVDAVPSVETLEETAHASLLRRLLKNPTGLVSMVFLALVLLVAIFAPWLAPQDPNRASALDILASPSSEHWLGTDGSGHDILSRLIVATRTSVAAALVALVVAAVIGISSGLVAGYYGRKWSGTFSWLASALMALPPIVMLLAARSVLGPSIWGIMVIFGILVAPAFYRVVYGAVTGVRHELYVDAARVFGLSDARIIGRHILSVVRAPAIILAAGVAGVAIAVQAGLDFLGLGDLSKPSWGGMLNDAFANIYTKPINLLWPSLAIGLTCIALALFGNALRDELERSAAADTLTLGSIVPATTQSAADSRWANESPYMQAVYDTLVHLSPTGEPEPWLATEWSLNDDKTVMTLKLRTDVKFTDGTPFNADAAAQNILRFRDGTSPNASNLANVADAKAVDDATLEITLTQPDPALLVYLGQNGGLMESPKQFGAADEQTKPVGSGPYVLDTGKTVVGSKYVYTKNADYWAPDSVYYDNLVITVLADKNTQVNAIKGGQVTGLNVIDQTTLKEIEGAGFRLFPHELDWTGLMLLDRAGSVNEALGKVEVRQAINYAIDRDAMLQAVAQGHGTVTGQIFPETSPGYDPPRRGLPVRPREGQGAAGRRRLPRRLRARHAAAPGGHHDQLRPGQAVPRRRGHHGQLHPAGREHRDQRHPRRQVRRHVLPAADGPDRVAGGELRPHRGGDVQPLPPA